MKQDLINRARRMTYALFAISLNRQEYRLILSLFSSSLDFWNNAQVKSVMTMPTLALEVELSLKHWYFWLTNQEAVRLIGHIPYTRVYGQLKSWQLLPEEAKVLLLNEWRRTTAKS